MRLVEMTIPDRLRKAADSINDRMKAVTGRGSMFNSCAVIQEVDDLRDIANELDACYPPEPRT